MRMHLVRSFLLLGIIIRLQAVTSATGSIGEPSRCCSCHAQQCYIKERQILTTTKVPLVHDNISNIKNLQGLRGGSLETNQETDRSEHKSLQISNPDLNKLSVSQMGKLRMSLLDLMVQARMLNSRLRGMRVSNIYDLNSKTLMLKMGGSTANQTSFKEELGEMASSACNDNHAAFKALLVIESGCRIHTTSYSREISNTPSNFAVKLRKHIRSQRLQCVEQLGVDRVLCLTFGRNSTSLVHLIVEFYAGGNIILCDETYTILALLRPYRTSDGERVAVKHTYPLATARPLVRMNQSGLEQALLAVSNKASKILTENSNKIGSKAKRQLQLLRLLTDQVGYGPQIVEHALMSAGWDSHMYGDNVLEKTSTEDRERLLHVFESVDSLLQKACSGLPVRGYLISNGLSNEDSCNNQFHDFAPFLLKQYENATLLEYEGFDVAVDEYFSALERDRLHRESETEASLVNKKLEKKKTGSEERMNELQNDFLCQQELAHVIEQNLEVAQAAINLVETVLGSTASWDLVQSSVQQMAADGNEVAMLINTFDFERQRVTLRLPLIDGDEIDAEMGPQQRVVEVPVDWTISAFANVRSYYQASKRAAYKAQRHLEVVNKRSIYRDSKAEANNKRNEALSRGKVRLTTGIRQIRKKLWFERFFWFVSIDGMVVVGGRDSQQNEQLVKRYMRPSDIYVHADVHGASTVLIRNDIKDSVVPMSTIQEAAAFAVCRSSAWKAKVCGSTPAWWVFPDQVSKSAESGEYVRAGGFIIRGKKHYVPVQNPVLGFGFLFRLSNSNYSQDLASLGEQPGQPDSRGTHEQSTGNAEKVSIQGRKGLSCEPGNLVCEMSRMELKGNQARRLWTASSMSRANNRNSNGELQSHFHSHTELSTLNLNVENKFSQRRRSLQRIEVHSDQTNENGGTDLVESEGIVYDKITDFGSDKLVSNIGEANVGFLNGVNEEQGGEPGSFSDLANESLHPAGNGGFSHDDVHSNLSETDESGEDNAHMEQGGGASSLVLHPSPEYDAIIQYALPVCGPITAFRNFRYQCRLVPGGLKRSQALNIMLKSFAAVASSKNKAGKGTIEIAGEGIVMQEQVDKTRLMREQELRSILACTESELLVVIPGDVRVCDIEKSTGKASKGSKMGEKRKGTSGKRRNGENKKVVNHDAGSL